MLGHAKHRPCDADGGSDLPGVIEHRRTDTAKPSLDLLVVHPESSPADQPQLRTQRRAADDRALGSPGQFEGSSSISLKNRCVVRL